MLTKLWNKLRCVTWIEWIVIVICAILFAFIGYDVLRRYFEEYKAYGLIVGDYSWLTPQATFDGLAGIAATLLIYVIGRADGRKQSERDEEDRKSKTKSILMSVRHELERMAPYVAQDTTRAYDPRVVNQLYHFAGYVPSVIMKDINTAYDGYFGHATAQVSKFDTLVGLRYVREVVDVYLADEKTAPANSFSQVISQHTFDGDSDLVDDPEVRARYKKHEDALRRISR